MLTIRAMVEAEVPRSFLRAYACARARSSSSLLLHGCMRGATGRGTQCVWRRGLDPKVCLVGCVVRIVRSARHLLRLWVPSVRALQCVPCRIRAELWCPSCAP